MKYIIAGNGPAAVHGVKAIRHRDPEGEILMISPEEGQPYSRITMPEYLTGEVSEEGIYFEEDFYERWRVRTCLGRRIVKIHPEERYVTLDDGDTISYEELLLATGSHSSLPSWADLEVPGVYGLWCKADAEAISSQVGPDKKAVIIGGGLVGMQAARALSAQGMSVTIVELADRLMVTQLDHTAADMLKQATEKAGIQVFLSTMVEGIEKDAQGRACGVRLENGKCLSADLVLVCVGVRPNLEMLDGLPIEHARGVLVDEGMRTSLPHVYAAGDVTQAPVYPAGEPAVRAIWLNAVEQGEIAGENMAGGCRRYEGSRAMNSIQLFGLSLISAGRTVAGAGQDEVILKDPETTGVYQKLVLDGVTLVGMLLAGDVQQAGLLYQKIGKPVNQGFWGRLPSWDPQWTMV